MQAFLKFICAKLGIAPTLHLKLQSNFSCCENFLKYKWEFISTQHLHVVASSILMMLNSAAMADTCSRVNLVCLFRKMHLLALP